VYQTDAGRTTLIHAERKNTNMAKTIPTKPVDRSAITGRFVTGTYADKHPKTTEHEHVPVHNPKKK
jgi:hypothetical protein